jgi:CDP-diacylglycerol--serine O-phosphatidyltransferase
MRNPHGGGGSFFVGLPIPLAAGVLVSMIIAHHSATAGAGLEDSARGPVAVAATLLALLMVSTVRYRTFKDLRLSRRSAIVLMLVLASGVVIGTRFHPAYVLVAYSFAYLAFGLVESAFLVRNRLVARKVGPGAVAAAVLEEEDALEDEDEDEQNVA